MLLLSAMLESMRRGGRRSMIPVGMALTAALAVSSSGCVAVFGGLKNTSISFPIIPHGGTFSGWTEISVGGNINSVSSATLQSVTLDVEMPAGTPDLSFLSSLTGEAVTPTGRTTVVTLDQFPKGEQAVVMHVVYTGDLHPLFKDDTTIHIDWTGTINPAFTAWPADGSGFQLGGDIQIDVE